MENGIIKRNKDYIKIIHVKPINYNLKSAIEQNSILNSYTILLKTCNFNFQIIIKNNQLNVDNYIENINLKNNLSQNYINFLKEKNKSQKLLEKHFYIIVKDTNLIFLKEKFLKIKECLSRCGNETKELSKIETEKTLESFYREVII